MTRQKSLHITSNHVQTDSSVDLKCSHTRGFSFTVKTKSKTDKVAFQVDAEEMCKETALSEHVFVFVCTSGHAPTYRWAGFCFEVQSGRKLPCLLPLFPSVNSRKILEYFHITGGGFFPRGKSGRGEKLVTHLHLVYRLGMTGAVNSPPPIHMTSWGGQGRSCHHFINKNNIRLLPPLSQWFPSAGTEFSTVYHITSSFASRCVSPAQF
jgi:hypothetical protein